MSATDVLVNLAERVDGLENVVILTFTKEKWAKVDKLLQRRKTRGLEDTF